MTLTGLTVSQLAHRFIALDNKICSYYHLEVWQLGDAGPQVLGGRPQHPEDPEQLVNLGVALEQRPPVHHLSVDGADTPDVDGTGILGAAEENLE